MYRFYALFLCLLFLVPSSLSSQKDIFVRANAAYSDANYDEAIELYTEVLSMNFVSPDLYLNLGNSYLKKNNLGKAILQYEKGLKLDNRNVALHQNLNFANKNVETQITLIPDFFIVRYWNNVVHAASSTMWSWIQIILGLLVAGALWYWLINSDLTKKRKGFYGLIVCVVLFILSLLLGTQKLNIESSNGFAVVMADSAELLSSASESSEKKYGLSEGVKLKLIDKIGDFYKVELLDKEVGWIDKSLIELI